MADEIVINDIVLTGRGGKSTGAFRVRVGGIEWTKLGGGSTVQIDMVDILSISWLRVQGGSEIDVKANGQRLYKFMGFCSQDVNKLTNFFGVYGITLAQKELSVSGQNWGKIQLDGNSLAFSSESKQAFEIPLMDISTTKVIGKNDVVVNFHTDDTTSDTDALVSLTFHVPDNDPQFGGHKTQSAAEVLHNSIMTNKTRVESSGHRLIVTFEDVFIFQPRGNYNAELYLEFMCFRGKAKDFKVSYTDVIRIFVLPKNNELHTFAVLSLANSILIGQTFHQHIVMQFKTEDNIEVNLLLNEDQLSTAYNGKATHKGCVHEVLTTVLRGLTGARITRSGNFRNSEDGGAVKASLNAKDGLLYPLEKGLFFLPKPPTFLSYDQIEQVQFVWPCLGGSSSLLPQQFNFNVRLRTNLEFQLINIQKEEYTSLFNFVSGKDLKVVKLDFTNALVGVTKALQFDDDDDEVGQHLKKDSKTKAKTEAGTSRMGRVRKRD